MTDKVKKVYLKDITFDFEADDSMPLGAHISYTTASVGGAASGLNAPLLLKSDEMKPLTKEDIDILKAAKEIRIEMSMEDFLQKFMGLYYSDAAVLAKLLGFESSMDRDEAEDDYEGWLESKLNSFTLLKSMGSAEAFYKLSGVEQRAVLADQESFEKALKENHAVLVDAISKTATSKKDATKEPKKEDANIKVSKQKGEEMNTSTTTTEDINKALSDQLEALQKQVKEFQEKEDKRIEKQYVEKAKTYSFIEADKAETFGKLLKSLTDEAALLVLETLEKAKEAVEKAQDPMFERMSARGEAKETTEVTKSKSATKAAVQKMLGAVEGDE